MWAIDTANANCWASAEAAVVRRSAADILLLQETKRFSGQGVASATVEARTNGWNPVFTRAHCTGAAAGSGGGAVLTRRGSGIRPLEHVGVLADYAHRITLAWVDAVVRGGITCMSIYLRTAEGLSQANAGILEQAAVALNGLRGPWIVGGDWNIQPDTLADSRWLQMVGGVIFATDLPTCNDNTYDYFVVHRSIAHAVVGVQRLEDGGMNPHWASRLLLRGDARRFAIRELVRPPKVGGLLPHGPSQEPPDYSSILELADSSIDTDRKSKNQSTDTDLKSKNQSTDGELDAAMVDWYKAAREEFSGITGTKLHFSAASFKWKCPAGAVAKPWHGSSRASVMWRALARRAEEAAKLVLLEAPSTLQSAVLAQHLRAAWSADRSLCNSSRAELHPLVQHFAQSLQAAAESRSGHWLGSLGKLAAKKAKKLEEVTAKRRTSEWRIAVGGKAPETGGTVRPTRLAYSWVRGIAGWVPAPVGSIQCNDEVPQDPELEDDWDQGDGEAIIPSTASDRVLAEVPLADQASVDSQADSWALLWQERAEYTLPEFPIDSGRLAAMLPDAIYGAARSFPVGTGLGQDNIAPRALLRLSRQAIVALAVLFEAFERRGQWTRVLDLVLIVLLPKSDGGFRPIGLFPTVVRIWMRARIGIARAWEASNSVPYIYGSSGMGAQVASWQAAFTAESAALCKMDHVQALLDLVKAFETVPHWILVQAAIAKGYSIIILRLSIAAYRLSRSVGIEGAYSRRIVATRGITAGSGFATSELRLLLFDVVGEIRTKWGAAVSIKLYVDDLTLAACGLPLVIVQLLIRVLNFVVDKLENGLCMEVSAKKSKVLAGRAMVAEAVAAGVGSKKLTATTHAKLLGTDSVGGRRRSTATLQKRIRSFNCTVPRLHALLRAGVNTKQMVRAAGTPAILYGCEVMGVSDTCLLDIRRKVAAAAAPEAGGKNPERTLYALDGSDGTLDPAFEAHASPIKHWALAWWEHWFTPPQLAEAFAEATAKMERCKGSWWSVVAGPVAALLASIRRIGWTMPCAGLAVDDLGFQWNFLRDSPAAIAQASRDSVRRWRLLRVGDSMPGLIPDACDVGHPWPEGGTILCDFSMLLAPLVKGKGTGAVTNEEWNPRWKGDLASAISGGQWPQARKAAVPSWGIEDQRCQLCLGQTGTLAHRFVCPSTKPADGWPCAPPAAARVLGRLSERRKEILQTTGLLVLRLPTPPQRGDGTFRWLKEPAVDDPRVYEARWYFDGSLFEGKWKPFRATGFGVAVITPEGELLGFGHGSPPAWCNTAAAAEAWALQVVVAACPFPPPMRTDCLSLLHAAQAGMQLATAPNKKLARIWCMISLALDGDLRVLAGTCEDSSRQGHLVWMPAHQSLAMVGEKHLSSGERLSFVDWRANRLVDALAKSAAEEVRATPSVRLLLASAAAVVKHSAALLGRVTHAANNQQEQCTDEDGNAYTRHLRDAVKAPRASRKHREEPGVQMEVVKLSAAVRRDATIADFYPYLGAPIAVSQPLSRRAVATRLHGAHQQAAAEAFLRRRVDEIGGRATARVGQPTAAERWEALHARVLQRAREAPAASEGSLLG